MSMPVSCLLRRLPLRPAGTALTSRCGTTRLPHCFARHVPPPLRWCSSKVATTSTSSSPAPASQTDAGPAPSSGSAAVPATSAPLTAGPTPPGGSPAVEPADDRQGSSGQRGPVSWATLALVVALGSGVVAYYNVQRRHKKAEAHSRVDTFGKPALGGPWSLVDAAGRAVTSGDLEGVRDGGAGEGRGR